MKLCPTCGFGLWPYDQQTLTCKNGHHHPIDSTGEVVHPKGRHLAVSMIAGALSAGLIEALVHLL